LLDRFYQTGLLPRLGRSTLLRDESASRKIVSLRDAVIASMEAGLDRGALLGNLNRNRLEELEGNRFAACGKLRSRPSTTCNR
jgi:hypothetical protein